MNVENGNRKYKIFLHSFYILAGLDLIFGLISILKNGIAVLPFDGVIFLSIIGVITAGNSVEHITKKVGLKIIPQEDKNNGV